MPVWLDSCRLAISRTNDKTHYFGPWLLNIKMGKKKYFIDNMNQYNYCVNYVFSSSFSGKVHDVLF